MVMDNLGLHGIEPAYADESLQRLVEASMTSIDSKHPVPNLRPAPIIDLTLAGSATQYAGVLAALAQWDACDAAVAVVGSSARSKPGLAVHPILEHAPSFTSKPFAAFFAPEADEALALLSAKHIAGFRTPECCADAIAAMLRPRGPRRGVHTALGQVSLSLLESLTIAFQEKGQQPSEAQAYALFESLSIPCSPHEVFELSEVADAMKNEPLDPYVLKIVSHDMTHKSDVGGVLLDLDRYISWDQALEALRDRVMQHHSNPSPQVEPRTRAPSRFHQVLVQKKQKALGEVLIGYRHDAVVGPVLVLGIGGIEAALNPHVALRPAPIDLEDAYAMIAEIPGLAKYQGFRNLPKGNMRALALALCDLSRLACDPRACIDEAEINPLFIMPEGFSHGVMAVDAVVRLRAPAKRGPDRSMDQ
jgi:acyl-CoA synthetase (NDP forming)